MSATKRMLISLLVIAITTTGCRPYQKTPLSGRLTILSEPTDGADIFINKRKQAFKTNAWFNLKPGFYKISLVKEDKIGEAVVTVKAGRSSRLTIKLNKMAIVPAPSKGPPRPETRGQKVIFDYYAALAAGDFEKAFAHLGRRAKWAQGGRWRWQKNARTIASIKVTDLEQVSSDATRSTEVNRVALSVVEKALKGGAAPPAERVDVLITTVDEFGLGLPKIDSIVDASATAGGT